MVLTHGSSRLRRRLGKFGNRLGRNQRGATMLLVALSMSGLIGATGLAVDVAQWMLWKRELQYAVDQAAMSGAYSLSKDANGKWKERALIELQSNEQIVNFKGTPTVNLVNFGDAEKNSVYVQVTATRKLPFSGMFMSSPAAVTARAQATYDKPSNYTSCLVATNTTDTATIVLGGNSTIAIQCGIAALSNANDAITVDGNPTVDAGYFVTAGTVDSWISEHTDDSIYEHVGGLSDPFKKLTPPNNTTARTYACATTGSGKNKVTSASLLPGTYSSIDTNCDTALASGIYVIDGGQLKINAQYTFVGAGVMFVLKNGASIDINGGANISLTAPTVAQLAAMGITDERLAGMLVFEDISSSTAGDSKINGNASTIINGKIYMPKSQVTMTGTATVTSQCLMIVADKIKLTGNGTLGSFCPAGQHVTDAIGGPGGRVYLVA